MQIAGKIDFKIKELLRMKKFIIYSPGRDNNSRFEPNK